MTEIPPAKSPHAKTKIKICFAIFCKYSLSPLPSAFAVIDNTATPSAAGILFTSHVTVVVTLTDAVAFSPRCPTIAVSTYCNNVDKISSKMVGIDNITNVFKISRRLIFCSCIPYTSFPDSSISISLSYSINRFVFLTFFHTFFPFGYQFTR